MWCTPSSDAEPAGSPDRRHLGPPRIRRLSAKTAFHSPKPAFQPSWIDLGRTLRDTLRLVVLINPSHAYAFISEIVYVAQNPACPCRRCGPGCLRQVRPDA